MTSVFCAVLLFGRRSLPRTHEIIAIINGKTPAFVCRGLVVLFCVEIVEISEMPICCYRPKNPVG